MPAYFIAVIRVEDPQAMKEYLRVVPSIVEKHGGSYVVYGAPVEALEGSIDDHSFGAVVEFPSAEAARNFYDDVDYAPMRTLRQASAKTTIMLLDTPV